jgi:hypothetical protein
MRLGCRVWFRSHNEVQGDKALDVAGPSTREFLGPPWLGQLGRHLVRGSDGVRSGRVHDWRSQDSSSE